MFGKKKQPLPPFPIQILTAEDLIEGTLAGDTSILYGSRGSIVPLPLSSVQIRTTGPVDIPPRTCAQMVVMGNNAVALIPRVEITQRPEYEFWKQYTKSLQGMFYVGPYVMLGRLMLPAENFFQIQMPIFDVHIASQVPGARWGELRAQVALVNFDWLRGYELSQSV